MQDHDNPNNYFPPKKSVVSAGVEDPGYLRARIQTLLDQAQHESSSGKRGLLYDRIRELTRILRQKNGNSVWAPLAWAVSLGVVLVVIAQQQIKRDFTFSAPADKFQILKRLDAHHYTFRHIHDGRAVKDLPVVFCQNFEPQLSAGMTLTYLHYIDAGKCWNILPEGYGYSFETTDGKTPTLAPNCFPNYLTGLYECKPNKTEATWADQ